MVFLSLATSGATSRSKATLLGQTEYNFEVVDALLCDWQLTELFRSIVCLGFALSSGTNFWFPDY
jgi:hypothetical protein